MSTILNEAMTSEETHDHTNPQSTDHPHPDSGSPLERRKVVCVASNPGDLMEIEGMLRTLDEEWQVELAGGFGPVQSLIEDTTEAVLVNASLEDSEAIPFLNQVQLHFPRVVRFVRCGEDSSAAKDQISGMLPHFLSTELEASSLTRELERCLILDRWMLQPRFREMISQMTKMPTLPTLYNEVAKELNAPEGSMETVAEIITRDPSMAAQILKQVNSAVFGFMQEISDLRDAVMMLGGERIKSLILLSSAMGKFDRTECRAFDPDDFWKHSLSVAKYARAIFRTDSSVSRSADQAYTAGLLHDVGKLLLASNFADRYSRVMAQVKQQERLELEVEQEIFKASHGEVGGCLLAKWGLPLPLIKAAAWHHLPAQTRSAGLTPMVAVHVANAFDHGQRMENQGELPGLDLQFLAKSGMTDLLDEWLDACRDAAQEN